MLVLELACAAAAVAWPGPDPSVQHTPACRDRFLEPFASSSIWNTAIGSDAIFKDANLFAATDFRG